MKRLWIVMLVLAMVPLLAVAMTLAIAPPAGAKQPGKPTCKEGT